MQTTHTTFYLAGQTVHCIAFNSQTFTEADLLWLPHHHQLSGTARKRKAEHLAGRVAAVQALTALGESVVPARGINGEPLWPRGVVGSITHSGNQAMAFAIRSDNAVAGIDYGAILPEREAVEIKDGVIDAQEEAVLSRKGYPFALTLTLAFSAKESLFKALFPDVNEYMGFDCARVTALDARHLTLRLARALGSFKAREDFSVAWKMTGSGVCTLVVR